MKSLSVFALVLSAIAIAVTLTREFPGPATVTVEAAELHAQVDQLREEVAALKASQGSIRRPLTPAPPVAASAVTNLKQQVADLAESQSELADLTRSIDPLGVIEATERQIADAYATLVDENRQPWERAKQAETLKKYGQFDGAAVNSMRHLLRSAENPAETAAALVALRGYVTPDMRDEILAAFSAEIEGGYHNGRLRYHGIEALEPLLPDPIVEDWMTYLAENDPEPKIAGRAARAVGLEIQWEGK